MFNKKMRFGPLVAILLSTIAIADAQQPTTIPKVGWLGLGLANTQQGQRELLWRELSKIGYVEGKNITVEYRYAENNLVRLPGLADELVRLKVALIHTGGTNAARAAKQATKTIPIVFNNVNDPVPTGLVESLARPGANITRFAVISGILAGKRLELLKESLPKVKRVAVLWDPRNTGSVEQWKAHHQPAKELGLQLYSMEVSAAEHLESAFDAAMKAGSDALEMTQSPIVTSRRKYVAELAAKHRLPAIYHQAEFTESGGLMSYAADRNEPYRRVAVMIDKILKGTKPTDIPVEQPTKFEFVINLKTARRERTE